jgi:hypothetical protein
MRLAALALVTLTALAFQNHAAAEPPTRQVEVTNFPDPQHVVGAVEVTNLPATQDVAVTNLPAVQDVNVVSESLATAIQLVGFTSAAFTADVGVFGFTLACQAELSGSRMCTSKEVVETTDIPSGLTGTAWVRPSFAPVGWGSASVLALLDASGVPGVIGGGADGPLSCTGWSQASTTSGLTVDSDGRFKASPCSSGVHSVACCAPVP